jgi:hypothetical protein
VEAWDSSLLLEEHHDAAEAPMSQHVVGRLRRLMLLLAYELEDDVVLDGEKLPCLDVGIAGFVVVVVVAVPLVVLGASART